ncbi:hypothetical protein GXM_04809 [Nostoc sphaeroides CCNUC1]|uniref:Uncharacterized protein n=1 Tax=Nostoc sphaeroides CCNUC1 TaxID=2653204 RepID=A0A5P8W5P0_9NOSO|nr:hypothetical protein GXM_04809 [Nostoc sphaeroides CCNUC1]
MPDRKELGVNIITLVQTRLIASLLITFRERNLLWSKKLTAL